MPPLSTRFQVAAAKGGICLAMKSITADPTSRSAGNVRKGMTRSSSENLLPRLKKATLFRGSSRQTVSVEPQSRRFEG